ncbi:MAG: hypothetical protein ACYS76_02115 [Planctomycetota bacterium]|jgi:hypothetical protein
MAEEHKTEEAKPVKRYRILRKAIISVLVLVVLMGVFGVGLLVYDNVSLVSDETFAKQIDAAIERGLVWTKTNKDKILKRRNIGLLKMLNEIEHLRPTPVFSDIVSSFMAGPSRPRCWKRLVDPNWPVDELDLNQTIKKEYLDNKWVLYAMAPDKAHITPGEMQLFEPRRWRGRELVHQLDALIILSTTKGTNEELDKLIEHLSNRLSNELVFDIGLVDIGKVVLVLKAGFPQKIRRRWVERIVAGQLPDGGWDGRLLCFTSDSRPSFGFTAPPSNQHATILALTALYMVKYQYPEHFGLK